MVLLATQYYGKVYVLAQLRAIPVIIQLKVTYLYHTNAMGIVPKCQRECASNVQRMGGKSSNSKSIKQSTKMTQKAQGNISRHFLPFLLTTQNTSQPTEFRIPIRKNIQMYKNCGRKQDSEKKSTHQLSH
jgi:hypothetical protein